MSTQHTPGQSLDAVGERLVRLSRLARLERKEFGGVSTRTQRLIVEALAAAKAVCVVDDARAKATGSTQ